MDFGSSPGSITVASLSYVLLVFFIGFQIFVGLEIK